MMIRIHNLGSFLFGVVVLAGTNLGLAQSVPFRPAGQEQEPFAAVNRRLNEAADEMLVTAFSPSPAAERGGNSSMRTELPSAPPAAHTKFKDALTTQASVKHSLARLDLLRPLIEPELVRAGLPVELSGMVQVESGAQIFALSPRGARGLWQLMPDTARRYGLTVTTQQDERLDVYKSTRAAARYLRDLYAQFGNWPLAFAAYNAGEQTVQRAIDRTGTNDFSQLKRLLPLETRAYVPAVWASFAQFGHGRTVPPSAYPKAQAGTRVFYAETDSSSGVGHELDQ